jgi:hypothetical protein
VKLVKKVSITHNNKKNAVQHKNKMSNIYDDSKLIHTNVANFNQSKENKYESNVSDPRVVTGEKNSPTVAHACRKRRLKWVLPRLGVGAQG